ncbi:MAG: tRNA (5-methylaminomethyl-2-thiouridine)(34)-methyltransferase MnmD [Dysgonamonadaceae bacterium]|jgi:tRNA U34 5-methylaminomethyl-2-thiouridine-forming methyltransferase MnmC|nr:tRNA (5-methylaminomethyl-2-thiouridine)(34)-methyltransferase MnmD [Dysgonamonadaceae bacterium]
MYFVPTLKKTSDGSDTLYVPELNEHYHSTNGAVRESKYVYIESAFNPCEKKEIHVLEMGLGTGLNVLLTYLEARKRNLKVIYTGLEKYPLPETIINQLNYSDWEKEVFKRIHSAPWGKRSSIDSFFTINKIKTDFNDYAYPGKYDVVYYDAFAPDKQENVWNREIFNRIYAGMNVNGILSTYCAKGEIRRRMQSAGFSVNRLPGPPGKREMLQAIKTNRCE